MQVEVTTEKKLNLLTKITLVFFGIFLTSSIFAISIRITTDYGMWLGVIISAIIIGLGYHFSKKFPPLKLLYLTMLITITILILGFYVGLSYVTSELNL